MTVTGRGADRPHDEDPEVQFEEGTHLDAHEAPFEGEIHEVHHEEGLQTEDETLPEEEAPKI